MGVKSTQTLTHQEAVDKYVEMMMQSLDIQQTLRREALSLAPKDLECSLERLNDEAHGGEGFRNYLIEDAPGA